MPRMIALDYARGFTVLCIPTIHTVMVFSDPVVHTTIFGYALTFIAEGPGAQLFMLIMGIAFTFKKQHDQATIVQRALWILLAGYVLNFMKFMLPELFFGLPAGVHRDLQLTPEKKWVQLLLTGDILHFAAIALVIIHFVYRIKRYWCWSSIIAFIIIFASPLLYDCSDNYLIQLFTGQPPHVFFPVLPWIVYTLIGLTIGKCLQHQEQPTFKQLLPAGLIVMIIGALTLYLFPQFSEHGFYRTYPGETLLHIGIVLLTLWWWNIIARKFPANDFLRLLNYCSRHITSIYIIQWILVCWLLPLVGYQSMNTLQSVMMSICITLNTFIAHYIYTVFSGKRS